MKPFELLLLFITSSEIGYSLGNTVRLRTKSKRADQFWKPITRINSFTVESPPIQSSSNSQPYSRSASDDFYDSYLKVPTYSIMGAPGMSTMTSPSAPEKDKDKDKEMDKEKDKLKIPKINFYNTVPNCVGLIAQGLLWLREMSNAIGTPLPMWVGAIPVFLIGVGLMFLPDLTTLGLPLFYPNGVEGDPLAAFPPLPEITIPDLAGMGTMSMGSSTLVKALTDLLLPTPRPVMQMRRG